MLEGGCFAGSWGISVENKVSAGEGGSLLPLEEALALVEELLVENGVQFHLEVNFVLLGSRVRPQLVFILLVELLVLAEVVSDLFL